MLKKKNLLIVLYERFYTHIFIYIKCYVDMMDNEINYFS